MKNSKDSLFFILVALVIVIVCVGMALLIVLGAAKIEGKYNNLDSKMRYEYVTEDGEVGEITGECFTGHQMTCKNNKGDAIRVKQYRRLPDEVQ